MGYSVNGTGVMPLGYRKMSDGQYRVTLWITFFFIPIIPIGSRLVRPTVAADTSLFVAGDVFGFEIVSRENLNLGDVVRTYVLGWGLTILGLAPALTMAFLLERHGPDGGAPWWSIVGLFLGVAWPVFILGVLNQRQHTIHGSNVPRVEYRHESSGP